MRVLGSGGKSLQDSFLSLTLRTRSVSMAAVMIPGPSERSHNFTCWATPAEATGAAAVDVVVFMVRPSIQVSIPVPFLYLQRYCPYE